MQALDLLSSTARPATAKPLYAQVRDMLLSRIRNGEWGAGETLPNEHVLSTEFDVSIGTVRRAVAELENNGVLVRKQGRGTFVAGCGADALQSKFSALRSLDGGKLALVFHLLSLQRRMPAPTERERLGPAAAGGVIEIVQRIDGNGAPLGIETSVVASSLFPRLETQIRFGQHLYPVLADYGFLVTRVEDSIGLTRAAQEDADLLGAAVGEPLLTVCRLAIAIDARPIEVRSGRYLAHAVQYSSATT